MATLDIDRLRKVHRLMVDGSTEGERAAAQSRAEAIAKAAGMTLDAALSKLDAKPQQNSADPFASFDDWMEAKRPGWRTEQAAWRVDQVRRRQERQRRALEEFGSEDAVFAETEHERQLRVTLEPLADRKKFANSSNTYIDGYAGWTCRKPTPSLWTAIDTAYPLPHTVTGAWTEFLQWERLLDARHAFDAYYDTPVWVRARQAALSSIMDTYSEPTPEGMRAFRVDGLPHQIRDPPRPRRRGRDAEGLAARFRDDADGCPIWTPASTAGRPPHQRRQARRRAVHVGQPSRTIRQRDCTACGGVAPDREHPPPAGKETPTWLVGPILRRRAADGPPRALGLRTECVPVRVPSFRAHVCAPPMGPPGGSSANNAPAFARMWTSIFTPTFNRRKLRRLIFLSLHRLCALQILRSRRRRCRFASSVSPLIGSSRAALRMPPSECLPFPGPFSGST